MTTYRLCFKKFLLPHVVGIRLESLQLAKFHLLAFITFRAVDSCAAIFNSIAIEASLPASLTLFFAIFTQIQLLL